MKSSTSTKKHNLSQIDLEYRTAICSNCGPVMINVSHFQSKYIHRKYSIVCERKVMEEQNTRLEENLRVINEYKRRHFCKRCGYWSIEPRDFIFFEMHLPYKKKISCLARTMKSEYLKKELEKRDMYCKKCLRIAQKEYRRNILVEPVELEIQ